MATANAKGYTFLEEELKCPVCLELFVDPVILPCSHTLCRRCLQNLSGNGMYQGSSAIVCPYCRMHVQPSRDKLPKNLLIESIVHRYQETLMKSPVKKAENRDNDKDNEDSDRDNSGDAACDICTDTTARRAKVFCKHCSVSYCRECLEKCHPKIGGLADHPLEPAAAKIIEQSPQSCRDHQKNDTTIFCQSCSVSVCHLCICKDVGKHVSHEIIDKETAARQIKEKARDANSEIVKWCDNLSEQRSSLSKITSQIKTKYKNIADESKNEHKSFTEDIISLVDELLRIKLSKFKNEKTPLISKINSLEEVIRKTEVSFAPIKETCEWLETTSDMECLLNSIKDFATITKNLNECKKNVNESLTKINQFKIADDESTYVDGLVKGLKEIVGDMMKVYGRSDSDLDIEKFSRLEEKYRRNSSVPLSCNFYSYTKVEWSQINVQGPDFFLGLSSTPHHNQDLVTSEKLSYGVLCDKDILYFSRRGERKILSPKTTTEPITVLLSGVINVAKQYTMLGCRIFNLRGVSLHNKSAVIFDKELLQNVYPVFKYSVRTKLTMCESLPRQSGPSVRVLGQPYGYCPQYW